MVGREQHGAIPGDGALRRQRVHRLGAGDAGDGLHGEGRDARGRERPRRVGVGEGVEEADQDRSAREALDFRLLGRADNGHDLAAPGVADRGSGLLERGVRDVRAIARAGLDHKVEPTGAEAAHHVRHERHARLAGGGLVRHADLHPAASPLVRVPVISEGRLMNGCRAVRSVE